MRRLVIHISQTRGEEGDSRATAGQVTVGTRRIEANARVWDTRAARSERGGQVVQTVDGGKAYIKVGYSVPVPLRRIAVAPGGAVVTDSVVYQDIGRGFYAEPHVNGGQVTLDISQQADTSSPYANSGMAVQRLATTVTGRLGEWIQLGGSATQENRGESNGWGHATGEVRDSRSLWLMVEEIK